jgi:hypothetical protein
MRRDIDEYKSGWRKWEKEIKRKKQTIEDLKLRIKTNESAPEWRLDEKYIAEMKSRLKQAEERVAELEKNKQTLIQEAATWWTT